MSRKRKAAAVLAVILLIGSLSMSIPAFAEEYGPMSEAPLTVMTFNVEQWEGFNALFLDAPSLFEQYAADILAFQEYDSELSEDVWAGKGYFSVVARKANAVISRYALLDQESIVYQNQTNDHVRSYQKMFIEYLGKRICIANTHLTFSDKKILYAQVEELIQDITREEYYIITGDFNTQCTSVEDADYIGAIKPFLDLGCHSANCSEEFGFYNTWNGGTCENLGEWWQTDQIITSPNLKIEKMVVDQAKLNAPAGLMAPDQKVDHLPVIAWIRLNE